ncbi:hypothetical protein AcV5_004181 [Taiwanofungus camphoratus]|nr:hypothetical protein AcW2_001224 [Antrodia cinnamomea]KAI0935889.1 hypothetical protein AcV5_004181 [Antrodia cinnamomea]KAI0961113.1 hypothetical protein AcV7_000300 [Antrodia cinnamomea]
MRLPRRVPWASLSEIEQVCSWIYSDETDINAISQAVGRLAGWKAVTSLPHALESTLSLLTVVLQDLSQQGSTSPSLFLRQGYATAIIRLVNGLVDPLQLGAYARSIASIAAQLGLPAWLVELRHAATHEDLPSIELLRNAAREAMSWLLHNYFLPTLNPSTSVTTQRPALRSLSPLLKQYKTLLKSTTRDASLVPRLQPEITKVLRGVERWVAEAKVAGTGLDWDNDTRGDNDEESDGRERWALERLCDALIEKGVLVPISKKKRALTASFTPAPSNIRIWSLLLSHLQNLHPGLPSTLVFRIISHLTSQSRYAIASTEFTSETITLATEVPIHDMSYDRCLAGWANWIVDNWDASADDPEEHGVLRRRDVVITLTVALSPGRNKSVEEHKMYVHSVLQDAITMIFKSCYFVGSGRTSY